MNMNFTLQLHSNHHTYPVPRGLHDLISDIAKEVLRRHPPDIESFIANYMQALVKTREVGKGFTDAVDELVAKRARSRWITKLYGLTEEEAHYFATKIQATFRGWRTRIAVQKYLSQRGINKKKNKYLTPISGRLSSGKASAAATKIQAAFRGFAIRKKRLSFSQLTGDAWRHDWLWTEFKLSEQEINKMRDIEHQKEIIKEDLRIVSIPKRAIHDLHLDLVKMTKETFGDFSELTGALTADIFSHPEDEQPTLDAPTEEKREVVVVEETDHEETAVMSGNLGHLEFIYRIDEVASRLESGKWTDDELEFI